MSPLQVVLRGFTAVVCAAVAWLVAAFLRFAIPRSVAQPDAPRIVKTRFTQTTTLLGDGRVLVVGGEGPRRSVELYDPRQGAWSPVRSLSTGREAHSATLLRDGRVLVAGGRERPTSGARRNDLSSVEIYSPSSDTWTLATPMNVPRAWHSTALLPDGRVLVSGGIGLDPGGIKPELRLARRASSEVYDPERDTWTLVAPMQVARVHHWSVPLPDGRVFAAGGGADLDWSIPKWPRQTTEVYDPASDTWRLTAPVPFQVLEWLAAMPDGTVLASWLFLRQWAIYAPATDEWRELQSEQPPTNAKPIVLPDGLVLTSGGLNRDGTASVADVALFDPSTGTWTPTGSMGIARGLGRLSDWTSHTSVLLRDGTVLVYGGRQARSAKDLDKFSNPPSVVTSEIYDPATGTWSPRGRQ